MPIEKTESFITPPHIAQPLLEEMVMPCSQAIPIVCGQTLLNQTTANSGNDFIANNYAGCVATGYSFNAPDKVYKINVDKRTNVHIFLEILDPVDLDIFLSAGCPDNPLLYYITNDQLGCLSASYEDNVNLGIYNESIDFILEPFIDYYLFVDGYLPSQFGKFNLHVSCECTCTEPWSSNGALNPKSLLCENFENYLTTSIDPQSNRWRKWQTGSTEAPVASSNGNEYLNIVRNGSSAPDVLYMLDNLSTTYGRVRLSWDMFIEPNKTGYYNIQHALPTFSGSNNENANWAYEVYFNANGTGTLDITGNASTADADFLYINGGWNNVMQIIYYDNNDFYVELWINHNYVYTWQFGQGTSFSTDLAAINFFANTDNAYKVDNICLWKGCEVLFNCADSPTCTKSNQYYFTECEASCYGLYTPAEFGPCYGVCEQGGQLIHLGDTFTGTLTNDDLAPPLLLQEFCVLEAYDFNLPAGPMYADTYVLSYDSDDFIPINPQSLTGNASSLTKFFVFRCDCSSGNCVQTCLGEVGGSFNNCTNCDEPGFYYFVVLSPVNDNYGFQVFPSGACEVPQLPTLTCNGPTQLSGTVSGNNSDFSTTSSAGDYSSCYNGTRFYTGEDVVYRIDLSQPSNISFSLTPNGATEKFGMFLFDKKCGENCLGYAENGNNGGTFTLQSNNIDEGIYYLVVDKDVNGGNEGFSLNFTCSPTTPNIFITNIFDYDPGATCVQNNNISHTVGIRNFAFNFSTKHLIAFLVKDGSEIHPVKDMNAFWNGSDPIVFEIPADGNGGVKCSYIVSDSFFIDVYNTSEGYLSGGRCQLTFQNNSDMTFTANGESTINGLTPISVNNFGVSPNVLSVAGNAAIKELDVITNRPWVLEFDNAVDWINFSVTASNAAKTLAVTIEENNDCIEREADVDFTFATDPPLHRTLHVKQLGKCVTPEIQITPANGSTQVCLGQPITLNANITNSCNEAFDFLWSNGATTTSITLTPTLNQPPLTVTAKSKNCTASADKSIAITVNPIPTAPTYSGNTAFCAGSSITLQASAPSGSSVQWFDSPTSSAVIHQGNTFTPSPALGIGTHSFFLQSVNSGSCTSPLPRLQVNITVHQQPVPNAGNDKQLTCNSPTVVLSGAASTPATGATYSWAGPGIISGQGSPTATVNLPGTYTLSVTTGGICTATDQVIVTTAPLPVATASAIPVSCNGQSTGAVSVSVNNGAPNYQFLWSNGATTSTVNNLPAGNYLVTVTDANGCTTTATTTITQPLVPLAINVVSQGNINCNSPSASVNVTGSGGTGNYVFSWSNGQFGPTASFLAGGQYTVTLTDQNGCTTTKNGTIQQTLPPIASIQNQVNVKCNGFSNGSATASGTNGTPNYSFNWSNGFSGAQLNQVPAGIYTVTLTDGMGCTSSSAVNISQPPALVVGTTSTNVTVVGTNTGTASATASGGTPPYTFNWPNNLNTQNIINLGVGTYTVTVSDGNLCTATGQATVNPPACSGAGVNVSATPPSCNGGANGMAVATATGSPNFSFEWSNGTTTTGSNSSIISNLATGSYSVTMTDGNGCSDTESFFINQPNQLAGFVSSQTNVECFGENSGTVSLSATGGTAPYTFQWNNCGNCPIVNNLSAGIYFVTVIDGNNCTQTINVLITQPSQQLTVTTTGTDESAVNANDGTAIASPTGGTPPYTFIWNNGSTSQLITGLEPGTYAVTVEDANGCEAVSPVIVDPFPCIGISVDVQIVTEISCFGETDGTLTALPIGGTGPFNYIWSPGGATGAILTNIGAGTYTVLMTDASECEDINIIQLTQPPALENQQLIITDANEGQDNGAINVDINGGTPPYSFAWFNDNNELISTEEDLENVSSGNYQLEVEDDNGCEFTLVATVDSILTTTHFAWTENDIRLFPNPTSGIVFIEFSKFVSGPIKLTVSDVLGRETTSRIFEKTENGQVVLNLNGSSTGLYFLQIDAMGGRAVMRFVVQ